MPKHPAPRGCLFSNILHGPNSQRICLSSCPLLASVWLLNVLLSYCTVCKKRLCISSRYGKMLFDLFKSNLMHLGYCLPNLISSSLNIKGKESVFLLLLYVRCARAIKLYIEIPLQQLVGKYAQSHCYEIHGTVNNFLKIPRVY